MTTPEDKEDPDVTMVRALQLALKIAQENVARKQVKHVHFDQSIHSRNGPPPLVIPQIPTSTPIHTSSQPPPTPSTQYVFQSPLDNPSANKRILDNIMQTAISLPISDILAISPELRKQFKDQLWDEYEHTLHRAKDGTITAHHSIPL
ncbi:hypothetical protein AZE42_13898 [Rhizopogon vesiculosus]|uniref:DUF4100 domain-containing protein n=1 Tax=Rhizopogon vesiculosus TaxID=180088 RepID=A0A1J8QDY9_9AGAM|nr:hypothetical protein AZE42_13898 [Rhizopogon vesiculosus]